MDTQRAAALLIAICAAILVTIGGKSCTKNLSESNKSSEKPTMGFTIQIGTGDKVDVVPTQSGDAQITPDPTAATQVTPDPTADPNTVTQLPTGGQDVPPELTVPETTATKSLLDQFWDSEKPSYIDPYGNGGYGNGGY